MSRYKNHVFFISSHNFCTLENFTTVRDSSKLSTVTPEDSKITKNAATLSLLPLLHPFHQSLSSYAAILEIITK